eukprot:GAHX01003340.1.p1 GENE.GAHX01003340.1~~GAHX01003340.1.p1  ORF type:complete len:55 (-),score=3.89 GAHX01003340.1:123-287(-)
MKVVRNSKAIKVSYDQYWKEKLNVMSKRNSVSVISFHTRGNRYIKASFFVEPTI